MTGCSLLLRLIVLIIPLPVVGFKVLPHFHMVFDAGIRYTVTWNGKPARPWMIQAGHKSMMKARRKDMGEGNIKVEEAVKKWLSERGYEYEVRTYVSDEPGAVAVKKEKDTISIPAEVEDVEAFMEQFAKTFEQIHEITELKNSGKA